MSAAVRARDVPTHSGLPETAIVAPRASQRPLTLRGTDRLGRLRLEATEAVVKRWPNLRNYDSHSFNRRVSVEWHRRLRDNQIYVEGA